jgi:putative heme transporter
MKPLEQRREVSKPVDDSEGSREGSSRGREVREEMREEVVREEVREEEVREEVREGVREGPDSGVLARAREDPSKAPPLTPPAAPPSVPPSASPTASPSMPPSGSPPAASVEEEMPRVQVTRRSMWIFALFVVTALAFLYIVLPQLGGVKHTWDRLNEGDSWWIGVAVTLQVTAMASYIAIFQGVHVPPGSRITFRESYLITMAGLAATRLFAAGGAGGVAVTAWALRRSGMRRREVAERMIAFLVLLYGAYMVALIVCGVGLYTGLFAGEHPFAITIGPAIVAATAILVALAVAFLPKDIEQRLHGERAPVRWLRGLATGSASVRGGVRFAGHKLRHPDWAMTGVVGWWGLNIAVLYAAFRAFGQAPPTAVLVQAYFVGMLANLLPLPGGIGGVDGGMIGAFVAFGVSGSLALIAVLVYRLLSFWLPSIPGAIAYFQLRRTVNRWKGYTIQSKATQAQAVDWPGRAGELEAMR